MNPLQDLLQLSSTEKDTRGLLHTPAEIAQQPAAWAETLLVFKRQHDVLAEMIAEAQRSGRTVFLIGAGTSEYIGNCLAPLWRVKLGLETVVAPSTDLLAVRDEMVLPGRKYLWVHFSRSGDSPESAAVLERALHDLPEQVRHIVVTCNASGRMAQLVRGREGSACVVLPEQVNDRSLAMTSSFSSMVVLGQAIAHVNEIEAYATTLEHMKGAAQYMLNEGATLAHSLVKQGPLRAAFVGIGALYGAARESALKLRELTAGRLETMSETSLGLRHGPMSALNDRTVFICFVSREKRLRSYDADLVNEVVSKGAVTMSVAVGATDTAAAHHLSSADFEAIPDACRPPVDAIFGQLLGLFASVEAGLKPDTPSPGGIITRVVKPFTLY